MKIILDDNLCEGNGVCESIAPELFRFDDGGRLHVHVVDAPTPEHRARAAQAVRYCPKGALRLVEDGDPTHQPERTQP
ncbi:ferredoxin [Sorangium sp. So ce1000]|uniref:ferredoxin n=1 Tax=Sorangium sp. So ce1000 TaxID=3133325 RepID=UPI003F615AA1